jgi:hypothetical protein
MSVLPSEKKRNRKNCPHEIRIELAKKKKKEKWRKSVSIGHGVSRKALSKSDDDGDECGWERGWWSIVW